MGQYNPISRAAGTLMEIYGGTGSAEEQALQHIIGIAEKSYGPDDQIEQGLAIAETEVSADVLTTILTKAYASGNHAYIEAANTLNRAILQIKEGLRISGPWKPLEDYVSQIGTPETAAKNLIGQISALLNHFSPSFTDGPATHYYGVGLINESIVNVITQPDKIRIVIDPGESLTWSLEKQALEFEDGSYLLPKIARSILTLRAVLASIQERIPQSSPERSAEIDTRVSAIYANRAAVLHRPRWPAWAQVLTQKAEAAKPVTHLSLSRFVQMIALIVEPYLEHEVVFSGLEGTWEELEESGIGRVRFRREFKAFYSPNSVIDGLPAINFLQKLRHHAPRPSSLAVLSEYSLLVAAEQPQDTEGIRFKITPPTDALLSRKERWRLLHKLLEKEYPVFLPKKVREIATRPTVPLHRDNPIIHDSGLGLSPMPRTPRQASQPSPGRRSHQPSGRTNGPSFKLPRRPR